MPGTISQATHQRYERHQKTVERLDADLKPYGLHFLLTLPDHKSMLTNEPMTHGLDYGIRNTKATLHFLKNGTLTGDCVRDYIKRTGRELIKSQYPQSYQEMAKNLEAIANSRCAYQPAHVQASLWNAIEILEDLDEKERNLL